MNSYPLPFRVEFDQNSRDLTLYFREGCLPDNFCEEAEAQHALLRRCCDPLNWQRIDFSDQAYSVIRRAKETYAQGILPEASIENVSSAHRFVTLSLGWLTPVSQMRLVVNDCQATIHRLIRRFEEDGDPVMEIAQGELTQLLETSGYSPLDLHLDDLNGLTRIAYGLYLAAKECSGSQDPFWEEVGEIMGISSSDTPRIVTARH